jgi:carboxymethylenebutenolidase
MGRKLFLRAADGHQLGAYRADPPGTPRGRVVVIQEIFGVNRHIRSVCDRLAQAGYVALAPQIFDRLQRDFESGYSEPEVARAREFIPKLDWDKLMLDVRAAVDALKREGPVAILGFCLGGSVAFVAATRFDGLVAAICYYGGMIAKYADNKPRSPTQMHFGDMDSHVPMSDVGMIRAKRPDCDVHVYAGAGHGFHCDERGSYEPKSAAIAWERSLAFLARAFGAPRPAPAAKPAPKPAAKPKAKPRPKAKKKVAKKAKKRVAKKGKKKAAKKRKSKKRR